LDGALALDSQLRVSVLKMAPHFVVRNGVLMRRVNLGARAGPARTINVPAIPLLFIETVLHYCHSDIFSAHLGKTKTSDKVRHHAYWHGWKKDVVEYVKECLICSGGKGHRPWRAGLMQRMPVQELSGPFPLLVVDAIGPLVVTPRENKYILVFVDYFTRCSQATHRPHNRNFSRGSMPKRPKEHEAGDGSDAKRRRTSRSADAASNLGGVVAFNDAWAWMKRAGWRSKPPPRRSLDL